MASAAPRVHQNVLNTTLLVVGLGYFIDAFDLFLYNSLRVPSLRDLGLEGDALVRTGLNILNLQVFGMLVGGFVWGVIGDRAGRKRALVGSVLVYSLGSLGCAFVQHVPLYALLRFLTGIGLAGEIGLGAILVTETLPDAKRNWGLAAYNLFAHFGIIAAGFMASQLSWRECYALGGAGGLVLLLGRIVLFESGLYEKLLAQPRVKRGSLKTLFGNPALLKRWLCCIFFMMPYFYMINLLVTLAPEFARATGVTAPITASKALIMYFICASGGTFLAVMASKLLQKRLLALVLFMTVNLALAAYYLLQRGLGENAFYALCGALGLGNYFVLLLFAVTEQFGTNMRATAGVSAISIGRTTLVITNSLFLAFRAAGTDILAAAGYTGTIAFAVGFICLFGLRETYAKSVDFLESA